MAISNTTYKILQKSLIDCRHNRLLECKKNGKFRRVKGYNKICYDMTCKCKRKKCLTADYLAD